MELTREQQECVETARERHNFSIYGEAGTGKSLVVSEICRSEGKRVQVVCSTGIACEVFKDNTNLSHKAITIHSFLGIGTAQGPFQTVVKKASEHPLTCKRLKEAECIIWDECSMGSARLLELFHVIASTVRGDNRPFGGIQCILVGDWMQLKPVADKFDEGLTMFHSRLFPLLFPHTIKLSVLFRQDDTELRLKEILRQLRVGRCDIATSREMLDLRRELLDINDNDKVVHLYFTNLLVNAHNASCLDKLPGEMVTFSAKDAGSVQGIQCPAAEVACFKEGAPVMVLYNINNDIHNGTCGVFVKKISEDAAIINISGSNYQIKRVAWTNVNKEGVTIGYRMQMPLALHWASTVHKSQGMTLEKVVIHSAYEFTGGLLYTAMSRARSFNDVQVIGFDPRHVLNREKEQREIEGHLLMGNNRCTCGDNVDSMPAERVADYTEDDISDDISDEALLEIVQNIFEPLDQEDEENEGGTSMEAVLELIEESEHALSSLPDDFDVRAFLTSLKGECYGNNHEMNFGFQKNQVVDEALSRVDIFSSLIQIVWFKIFQLVRVNLKENIADTRFSTKEMKSLFQKATDVTQSNDMKNWLRLCFNIDELKPEHHSIGFDIVLGVLHNIIHVVADIGRAKEKIEMTSSLIVKEMDNAGLSKIRFVGAWAISKVVQKSKKYVKDHLYTRNKETRARLNRHLERITVLESTVIVPYDIISLDTKLPETLEITEARQYRKRGLMHVTDEYFEVVQELEQRRIELLNYNLLKVHGSMMIENAELAIRSDKRLLMMWKNLFSKSDPIVEEDVLVEMYNEVVGRYMNMGAEQFVKHFRHKWKIKKAMAHRQMVMMRKEKQAQKEAKISIQDILEDTTQQKEKSHNLLKGLTAKFGEAVLGTLYKKAELIMLSKAYGLKPKTNMNKAMLGQCLAKAIQSNQLIPYPWSLVPEEQIQVAQLVDNRLGIRIRRIQNRSN